MVRIRMVRFGGEDVRLDRGVSVKVGTDGRNRLCLEHEDPGVHTGTVLPRGLMRLEGGKIAVLDLDNVVVPGLGRYLRSQRFLSGGVGGRVPTMLPRGLAGEESDGPSFLRDAHAGNLSPFAEIYSRPLLIFLPLKGEPKLDLGGVENGTPFVFSGDLALRFSELFRRDLPEEPKDKK